MKGKNLKFTVSREALNNNYQIWMVDVLPSEEYEDRNVNTLVSVLHSLIEDKGNEVA